MKEINHVEQTWKQTDFDVKRVLKEQGERVWTGCTQRSPRENCDIATLYATDRTRTGLGSKTDRPSELLYGLYGLTDPVPTAQ
jgi:hypothetical protein